MYSLAARKLFLSLLKLKPIIDLLILVLMQVYNFNAQHIHVITNYGAFWKFKTVKKPSSMNLYKECVGMYLLYLT